MESLQRVEQYQRKRRDETEQGDEGGDDKDGC